MEITKWMLCQKKKKNVKSAINILRFILLKERFKAQFLYRENLHILLLQHIYFDVWMFASWAHLGTLWSTNWRAGGRTWYGHLWHGFVPLILWRSERVRKTSKWKPLGVFFETATVIYFSVHTIFLCQIIKKIRVSCLSTIQIRRK